MSGPIGPRFYLDEDVDVGLVRAAAAAGTDLLSVRAAGIRGRGDEEQLAFATREQRAPLTHNIDNFTVPHERYQQGGWSHWGIVTARRLATAELARRLGRPATLMTAGALRNNLIPLELFRDDETAILVALAYLPSQA